MTWVLSSETLPPFTSLTVLFVPAANVVTLSAGRA